MRFNEKLASYSYGLFSRGLLYSDVDGATWNPETNTLWIYEVKRNTVQFKDEPLHLQSAIAEHLDCPCVILGLHLDPRGTEHREFPDYDVSKWYNIEDTYISEIRFNQKCSSEFRREVESRCRNHFLWEVRDLINNQGAFNA